MKVKKLLVVLAIPGLLTAIIATHGCDGGGSNPAGPSSTSYEKMIIGTWKAYKRVSSPYLINPSSAFIETFNADYSYVFTEPAISRTRSGTWDIVNGDILKTATDIPRLDRKIISITQSVMILREWNSDEVWELEYHRIGG